MTDRKPATPLANTALIAGFLSGDRESVLTIHAWVAQVVRLRAWRLHCDDDLIQDVLVDLIGIFGKGEFEERSSLQTYIQRITKYHCIDVLRRERLRNHPSLDEIREPLPALNDNPERQLIRSDETRLCYLVLSHMSEPCQELLRRLFAENTPYEDLACEHKVALGTITSRVARCRSQAQELRRRLTGSTRTRRKGGNS